MPYLKSRGFVRGFCPILSLPQSIPCHYRLPSVYYSFTPLPPNAPICLPPCICVRACVSHSCLPLHPLLFSAIFPFYPSFLYPLNTSLPVVLFHPVIFPILSNSFPFPSFLPTSNRLPFSVTPFLTPLFPLPFFSSSHVFAFFTASYPPVPTLGFSTSSVYTLCHQVII